MAVTVADMEIVVGADTKEAEKGLDNLSTKTKNFSDGDLQAASAAFLGFGVAGVLGFANAIGGAMNFEAALTDAYIALGDFEGGMDGLQQVIMDLGEALPFSATEVAGLVEELGKLGVTSENIEAVAYSVMSLAAGLGTDLVPTGEAVVKILNSLGLGMENVDEIADQLFRVLAAGTLDLDNFMDGWSKIGGIVKTAGMSFVDAAGFLSIFTDAGIEASTAGRVLAKLFGELMNPSEALRDMFDQLGITFTDTAGNLLPVKDIILNIMDMWTTMTTAEKFDLAEMIVGTEMAKYLITFLDQGREKFEEFMEKYNEAMGLKDVIAEKMGTAKMIWDTFMETLENASIIVGQKLLPAFKSIITWITGVVDAFQSLPNGLQTAIPVVIGLVTAFTGLTGVLGLVSQNAGFFRAGMSLLGKSLFGPLGAIMALAAGAVYAYQNFEPFRNIVDAVAQKLLAFGRSVANTVGDFISWVQSSENARLVLESLGVAIGVVAAAFLAFKTVQGIIAVINGIRNAMTALNLAMSANPVMLIVIAIAALAGAAYFAYKKFEPFRNAVNAVGSALKKLGGAVFKGVIKGFKSLWKAIEPVVGLIGDGIGKALEVVIPLFSAIGRGVMAFAGTLLDLGRSAVSTATNKLRSLGSFLSGALSTGFSFVSGHVSDAIGKFIDLAHQSGLVSAAMDFIGTALDALSTFFDTIKNAVQGVIDAFGEGGLIGALKALHDALGTIGSAFATLGETILQGLIDSLKSVDWGMIKTFIVDGLKNAVSNISVAMDWVLNTGIPNLFGWIKDVTGDVWGGLKSLAGWGSGAVSGLIDLSMNVLSSLAENALGMLSSAKDWVVSHIPWLEGPLDAAGEALSGAINLLMNIAGSIASSLSDAWSSFTSLLGSVGSWLSGFFGIGDDGSQASEVSKDASATMSLGMSFLGSITNSLGEAWSSLKSLIGSVVSWVVDFFGITDTGEATSQVTKNASAAFEFAMSFAGTVFNMLGDAWSSVKSVISSVGGWIADFFGISDAGDVGSQVNKAAGAAYSFGVSFAGKVFNLLGQAWSSFTSLLGSVGSWLGDFFGISDAGDVTDAVTKTISSTIDLVANVGGEVKDGLGAAWDSVKGVVGSVAEGAKDLVGDAWGGVTKAVSSTVDFTVELTGQVINKAKGWLGDLFGGGDEEGGMDTSGIDTAIQNITTKITEGFETIIAAFEGWDGSRIGTTVDTVFTNGIAGLSGVSLSGAIENWFWRAGDQIAGSLDDDALKIARAFDTSMNTAMSTGMSGASLATSIGQWFTKASSQAATTLTTPAMAIARALDTAINHAMTNNMSGVSLATAINGWITKATAQMSAGESATQVGLAVARSIDTAVGMGLAALSGVSLATGITGWVGRAMTTVGSSLITLGTSFSTLLNTAFVTGLGSLSGASLASGITGWVARAMTSVGTTLMTIGTSFGVLLNTAFVSGIGALSGASLGSAMKSYIDRGFQSSKTAIQTFANTTLADLSRWSSNVQRHASTAMNQFERDIDTGGANGKRALQQFASTASSTLASWSGDVRASVSSAMGEFSSSISRGTNDGRRAFSTFSSEARSSVRSAMNGVRSAVSSGMQEATRAIRTNAGEWASILRGFAGSMRGAGLTVGEAAGQGVYAGMMGALGMVRAAANALIAEVDRAMRAKARISSPSKMTTYFGQMIGEGLVVGMDDMQRAVAVSGQGLASSALVQPAASIAPTLVPIPTANPVFAGSTGGHVVINQTNHYSVNVDDLEDLNTAVEFVKDLPRERQLLAG